MYHEVGGESLLPPFSVGRFLVFIIFSLSMELLYYWYMKEKVYGLLESFIQAVLSMFTQHKKSLTLNC